ncbi:MAG TPA: sugar phosphate isomerase/epimerase [Steroidobacteraceae bacterium]|jgi:sugar phosphate isomerase/epimerase|nr:sugar phosphate isomerase/epimerase [Steroidobacteraceae bacterium]
MIESRRKFLIQSSRLAAAALASPWLPRRASANPLGRPIGIQLYTVNGEMKEDPAGTLKKIREIGFGEVETAGFGKLSAKQFRGLLDDAGLACPSAHLPFDMGNLGSTFEDAHALGATYAASGSLPPAAVGSKAADAPSKRSMSLDEAKRTAELVNRIGDAAKRAGLQYVYHNHDFEFADQGGSVGYDVLLRESDPDLVKFEIDCGWMIFAGRNPIDYFKKYPNRFPMIHVKDFLPAHDNGAAAAGKAPMLGAELGHGVVDYRPIFAAASAAGLKHYFVEQEGPFSRMAPLQAARVDYEYLHSLG